jgi:K+-sensing histidine kinase KdpD
MRDKDTDLWRPRNPITQRQTRQQVLWWVTIPVVVTAIIILVFVVMAARLQPPGASLWADISLIWMLCPAILFTVLMAAITGGSAYGVGKLVSVLPPFFYKVQNFARLFNFRVRQVGDKLTEPVMKINSLNASAKAARQAARRSTKRVKERDSYYS